jgi:hypothetical protein
MFSTINICKRSKKYQIFKTPDVCSNVKKKLAPTGIFFAEKRIYSAEIGRIVALS